MINYFENTMAVMEKFNIAADCCYDDDNHEKNIEIIKNIDFELAKALIADYDSMAIRVAKMILAHHDINDVKVKII